MQFSNCLKYGSLIASLAVAGAAHAQSVGDFQSAVTSNPGEWEDYQIWEVWDGDSWEPASSTEVPDDGDTVTIVDGDVVLLDHSDSALELGALTIETGATLDIDPSGAFSSVIKISPADFSLQTGGSGDGKVFIDADGVLEFDATGTVPVSGQVVLQHADSKLFANPASGTVTFDAVSGSSAGMIVGEDNGADLVIDSGVTLSSHVLIAGALTIGGTGNFNNYDMVVADVANGTITLDDQLAAVDDDSTALWKAYLFGTAKILFEQSATGLEGDFELANRADLEIAASVAVETTGELTCSGSANSIIIGSGGSFDTASDSYTDSGSPHSCP